MGSFILLFGRTLLALAAVLFLVWGLSRLARRGQNGTLAKGGAPAGARLEVLGRKSLSRTTSVAVVRVGERNLVVAVTPQSVTLISEIPAAELEPAATQLQADTPWRAESRQTPMAWDATISKLRELTIRR